MATPGAIAAMRDTAVKSLSASLIEIAQALNTEPPEIPLYNRSQDYLHADQLRVLSEFLTEITPAIAYLAKINAEMEEDLAATNGLWAFDSETGELNDPDSKFQIWHKSLGGPDAEYEVITSEISEVPAYDDITRAQIMEDLDALGAQYNARDNKDVLYALLQDTVAGVTDGDPNDSAD